MCQYDIAPNFRVQVRIKRSRAGTSQVAGAEKHPAGRRGGPVAMRFFPSLYTGSYWRYITSSFFLNRRLLTLSDARLPINFAHTPILLPTAELSSQDFHRRFGNRPRGWLAKQVRGNSQACLKFGTSVLLGRWAAQKTSAGADTVGQPILHWSARRIAPQARTGTSFPAGPLRFRCICEW